MPELPDLEVTRKHANAISQEQRTQTLRVLVAAMDRGASPQGLPDSFSLSHRREGQRCPR
jgi:hypothetical protein